MFSSCSYEVIFSVPKDIIYSVQKFDKETFKHLKLPFEHILISNIKFALICVVLR